MSLIKLSADSKPARDNIALASQLILGKAFELQFYELTHA